MIESISKDIFNFDLLKEQLGLIPTNIGFECPKCGSRFGIKLFPDQHNLSDVHPKRFVCKCQETTKEE